MPNTSNHKTRNNTSLIAQQPGKKTDCSMHETDHTFSSTEKTTYTLQKEPSILNPQLRSHIFTKRSKTFFKFGYSILLYFWPMRWADFIQYGKLQSMHGFLPHFLGMWWRAICKVNILVKHQSKKLMACKDLAQTCAYLCFIKLKSRDM